MPVECLKMSTSFQIGQQIYILSSEGDGAHIETKTLVWDTGIIREIKDDKSCLVEFKNSAGNLYTCYFDNHLMNTESEARSLRLPRLPKKINPPKEKKKRAAKPLNAATAIKFKEYQEKVSWESKVLNVITEIDKQLEQNDVVKDYLLSSDKMILNDVVDHYTRAGWLVDVENYHISIRLDESI